VTRHDGSEDRWFDRDAGPVVRPYALTMGRTLPSGGESFDLIDVVVATSGRMPEHFRPGPEHRRLLSLCRRPTPIVDLTSEIDLRSGWCESCLATSSARDWSGSWPRRSSRQPTSDC